MRQQEREGMLFGPRTVFLGHLGPGFKGSVPGLYSERNNAQLPDPEF